MATMPPTVICRGSRDGSRLARPAASDSPHTSSAFSGTNSIGIHPSAISAVMATFLCPSDATQIGIRGRTGRPMIFNALPSPVPSPSGSGMS